MVLRFAGCPLLFILVGIGPTWGQEDLDEVFTDPHVVALQDIMDQWDARELTIEKQEVEDDFSSALQRRAKDPMDEFEANENYVDVMEDRWSKLPSVLVPEKPLSHGARLVLIGSIFDRRVKISEELREPAELFERFKMAIYTVFSASQLEANEADIGAIDSRSILHAYASFWSMPWPICCWRDPR